VTVLVKICGLSNARDVDAAVEAGADAVGFVFAESVRRVSIEQAKLATQQLHSDIRKVAVMQHPSNEEWQDVLIGFRPDVLQTDIEDIAMLDVPDNVQVLPVIREGNSSLERTLPDVFVYEGAQSGQGEAVDWERAAPLARRGLMVLAGGLDTENVAEAISIVRPFGVDVSSGVESEPGVKDAALIRAFLGAAKAAGS
jgi:phosphoribosylanthranilate isomerase